MTPHAIQWAALTLCVVGALIRLPGVLRGHGRAVFWALVLLTVAVALSIAPIYEAVDGVLGEANVANLLLRIVLYVVFVLLGVRMAAAFRSRFATRAIAGPVGLGIVGVAVAATVVLFVLSDLAGSSTGLRAFGDQVTVRQYAGVGRLYPGYVAACLVGPALVAALDTHSRKIHRAACALLALSFSLVVVFVLLRLLFGDIGVWDLILPFSAILLTVLGLCLIWCSRILAGRERHRMGGSGRVRRSQ